MWKVAQIPAYLALSAAVSLAASAPPTPSRVLLRWKFTPGQTLRYVTQQKMSQKIEMGPTPVTMTTTMTSHMSWLINAVSADGVASLTQTMTRVQVKLESAQGTMLDYDSASSQLPKVPPTGMASLFAAMVDKPITLKMDPQGKPSDVQVPQSLVDSFSKLPGMGDLVSDQFIQQMAGLATLPADRVSPGDTWTNKAEITMPIFGKMETSTTMTYAGSVTLNGQSLEKFGVTQQMEFGAADGQTTGLVKITKQQTSGTTYFDNAVGHLADGELSGQFTMQFQLGDKLAETETRVGTRTSWAPAVASPEAAPADASSP